MWEVRPEQHVWAMLGRQGLLEVLPGGPGLRGKDTGGWGRGVRRKPTKLLFSVAMLGVRSHQALVRADGAKDSPWINTFQGNWEVSFVKRAPLSQATESSVGETSEVHRPGRLPGRAVATLFPLWCQKPRDSRHPVALLEKNLDYKTNNGCRKKSVYKKKEKGEN